MNPNLLPVDFADALDRARLRLGRVASEVLFFESIGSTNDVAIALAGGRDREGIVVVADEQTAGRGRRGHAWFSPPQSGLYVSVVLAPARALVTPDRAVALLTLAAGVALAEAVQRTSGLMPDVKWPNDLLVGRRKLAGILAEAVDRQPGSETRERSARGASGREAARERSRGGAPRNIGDVVLGYGINVGPMAYPPELADRATSLETELGRPIDRAVLFAETLACLAGRYDDLLAGRFDAILDAWRSRAPGSVGAKVAWETTAGLRSGVSAGIDDRGALLVQAGDRVERIVAGEVRWL